MFLPDNEEARKAITEKLDAFDEEIVRLSLEYNVSLKEIIFFLACGYIIKAENFRGIDDESVREVAAEVIRDKDANRANQANNLN